MFIVALKRLSYLRLLIFLVCDCRIVCLTLHTFYSVKCFLVAVLLDYLLLRIGSIFFKKKMRKKLAS